MVRIVGSHPADPGSIPGRGILLGTAVSPTHTNNIIYTLKKVNCSYTNVSNDPKFNFLRLVRPWQEGIINRGAVIGSQVNFLHLFHYLKKNIYIYMYILGYIRAVLNSGKMLYIEGKVIYIKGVLGIIVPLFSQ